MGETVLITGGAGFIGSHVADALLQSGYHVRVLDSLEPQVHRSRAVAGDGDATARWPAYLSPAVHAIAGDVCDPEAVRQAVQGCDAVIHLAATVGVGQSMYEVRRYTHANEMGTATLLEELIKHPVRRLVVASSMSIYGEGMYVNQQNELAPDACRALDQLRTHAWEPRDKRGQPLRPVPTPETKPPQLASIYAISKYAQEQASLTIGRAYDIPTVALRFFNVYGPRQALSNPYTGVLAIFASRLLNHKPPLIYEDGRQRRDFVHVSDVARACRLALESDEAAGHVVNIGSGASYTVFEVAEALRRVMNAPQIEPCITQEYRIGDIRHCFADISRAREILGYCPQVTLENGLAAMRHWLASEQPEDRVDGAREELIRRGLTV